MCGVKGKVSFRVCSLDRLCHTLHYSESVTLELELVQYNLVHLLHNLLLKI